MKKTDLKNEINNTRAYFQINDEENNMKKLDDLLVENQDVEDWFREEGESFEKGIEDEIVLFGHHIKINFYKLAQNSRYIRTHFTQFNVVSKLSSELFLFLNEFNHQSSTQSSLSSHIQMKYETENENIVDTQMKISHIEIFIKANQGEKFHLDMNNYFQLTELSSYFETFKFQKILYSYQKKYLNNPNFLLSYYLRRLQNFDFGNNNDNCMNNNNSIHKFLLDSHFLETKIINCLATSFESFLINYIPNEILYRILEKALKCSNTKGIPMNELFVFINNKLLERKIFLNFLELDELNTKNQMKFTELLRTYLNDETFICQLQFPTKYLLSLVYSNSQSLTLVHELISLLSNEIEEYGKRVQSILDIKLNTFNNLLYSEEFINKQMCLNTNIDHAEFKNLFLKLKLLFQKSIEKLTHYSEIKPKYDELSKVQEQLEAIKKAICDNDEEAAKELSAEDLLKKIHEDHSESKKLHETLDCDENNSEDKLIELQERSAELDKLRSEVEAIKRVICDNDEEAAKELSAEDLLQKIENSKSQKWPHSKTSYHSEFDRLRKNIIGLNKILIVLIMMNKSTKNHS